MVASRMAGSTTKKGKVAELGLVLIVPEKGMTMIDPISVRLSIRST
jgi:hypothetical protein